MPPTDQLLAAASQHLARNQRPEALSLLKQAVSQDPRHAIANYHLGMVLAQGGDLAAAAPHLDTAAAAMPADPGLQCNLGMIKSGLGQMDQAESHFRAALALNPRHTDANACLGMLLSNRQRAGEAETFLTAALALAPGRSDVVYAYSRLLTETGRAEESIKVIRAAQQLNPRDAFLQDKLCMMLNYVAGISDEELLSEHIRYGELAPKPDFDASPIDRNPNRRLRIGYLSADLRQHSVAYYLDALLESHDRSNFEVACYHVGAGDEFTPTLKSKTDLWRQLFPASDDAVLQAIRADRIDILIELAGHTSSNRLPILARRAAPIQVTYIGYPNTTGLPAIDYRIVDNTTDPRESNAHQWATEQLIRLDPCFLCYRAPDSAPDVAPSPAAGGGGGRGSARPEGVLTFGSFNNLAKLSPETIALWSRILRSVPNSRLVLKGKALSDPSIADRFLARFAAQQIAPDRLHFLPHTPSTAEHLAAYSQMDIALDPFPYAGTTTTCEALYMGVPVITLAGNRHASRVGTSLLSTLNLPELIATSPDHYHALATTLAANPAQLSHYRATLRSRLQQSPLCNAALFTPKLESAYRSMWQSWCARA